MAEMLRDEKTDREIADELSAEFQVDESEILLDLEYLKSELSKNGLDGKSLNADFPDTSNQNPSINNLTVYVTEQCNLRCKHCAVVEGKMPDDILTTEDIFQLIDSFKDISEKGSISFLGGEPFLHQDMVAILKRACESAPRVVVSTNGSFVTDEIARELAPYSNLEIQVSLDGADPAVHDFVRGRKSFEKTWKAIDRFLKAGIKKNLTIATTLTRSALEQVQTLIDQCDHKQVGTLRFLNLNKMKAARTHWDKIAPDPEEWKRTLRYLLFEASTRPNAVTEVSASFPGFVPNRKSTKDHWCPIGETLIVSSQKEVYNCPSLQMPLMNPGNLEKESIQEIASGKANAETRRWMLDRVNQVEECRVCNWRNFCGGGCTAFMAHRSGSVLKNDELCEFRRDLYREFALRKMGLYTPDELLTHNKE